ncbi:MAG: hypothetical protein KDA75_12195 [Planctomycetaceae bacterium]|nr:hypothetical protein [Planctomycetaceae bacterium]
MIALNDKPEVTGIETDDELAKIRGMVKRHLSDDVGLIEEQRESSFGSMNDIVRLTNYEGWFTVDREQYRGLPEAFMAMLRNRAMEMLSLADAIGREFFETEGFEFGVRDCLYKFVACGEIEDVEFAVSNASTDEEAIAKVRDFVSLLKPSNVTFDE